MSQPSSSKRRASSRRTDDDRRRRDLVANKKVTADSFHTSHSGSYDSGLSVRSRSSVAFRVPVGNKSEDPDDVFEDMPLARKRFTRRQAKDKENLAELILVWPHTGPGALKISLGDLRRLTPGEFLNDTVIEFGLQYWLHSLRSKNNPISEDIHVFSTFFYKKLNQRNFDKGYQSVRKWTKNVDIFKKKYIIVPINEHVHWYLAIIYRPEFVLRPPQAEDDPPRVSTRILAKRLQKGPAEHANPTAGAIVEGHGSVDVPLPEADQVPMNVDVDADAPSVPSCAAHSFLDYARSRAGPMVLERDKDAQDGAPIPVADDDDVPSMERAEPIVRERSISLGSGKPPLFDWAMQSVTDPAEPTVPLTPETLDYEVAGMENAEAEGEEANDLMKLSYIFTFDSLGGRHPQAIKNLQKYLVAEAEDKRKIPRNQISVPDGKKAVVPTQPNYCDCGLYLLHFAETFIGEPERFARAILTQGGKLRNKNVLWQNHKLPDMRSQLRDVISMLSDQWKETKAVEEERAEEERGRSTAQQQHKTHEDCDDEIVCEEPVVVPVVPKKPTSKASKRTPRK